MASSSSPSGGAVLQPGDYISEFLSDYDQNKYNVKFGKLAQTVADTFTNTLPKDAGDTPIKYKLFCRAKDRKSLERKLRSQAAKTPFESKEKLLDSERIWDLAGVRALAYFPDDVPIIAKNFSKLFPVLGKPIVKHSTREYHEPEGPDRTATVTPEIAHSQFDKYAKGTWSTRNSIDNVTKEWKHSGYLAVHFHVEVTDRGLFPELLPWQKRVEVQVTTFVMHAWSEVEHDIIYKNPYRLPHDPTIDRMVDAINGLSITSEILLQELQQTYRNLRDHEHEGLTRYELRSWFLEYYFNHSVFGIRSEVTNYSNIIINLIDSPIFRKKFLDSPTHARSITRGQVKSLLPEHAKASHRDRDEDGFYLLRLLLRNSHNDIKDQLRHFSLMSDPDGVSASAIHLLFKLLLVSSTYSIWRVVETKSWAKKKSPCLECEMQVDEINQILIGNSPFSSIEEEKRKELEMFCDTYLSHQCCDEHEVATNLAQLSFFICRGFGELPQESTLVDDQPSGFAVVYDPKRCPWPTPIDFRFLTIEYDEVAGNLPRPLQIQEASYHKALNTEYFGIHHEWNKLPLRISSNIDADRSVWWQYNDQLKARILFQRTHFTDSFAGLFWVSPRYIEKYLRLIMDGSLLVFRKYVSESESE